MIIQSKNPLTPLMLAAAAGNIEHVKELIEEGVDVNARGPRNSTALMYAVGGGHIEVVRQLVQHGADVEACEEGGWSALKHAREDEETEIVEFLESTRSGWLSKHRPGANRPSANQSPNTKRSGEQLG